MAATPESKVKKKVVKTLKELGCYYFHPVTSGYGHSGVPDIVVCFFGRFIGIEVKANGGVPTDLQKKNLNDILESGGMALVINEDNVDRLREYLTGKSRNPQQLELNFGEV